MLRQTTSQQDYKLGGSRLFLRLQDYESTRPQAGRLPAQYLQQKKTLKKTIKVIVYFVKY
jgi:hypothetical protein